MNIDKLDMVDHECQRAIMLALRTDYPTMRMLHDGTICALYPLLFTTSVVIGITRDSWERRYCYASPALAARAYHLLIGGDDEPLAGFVARRGAKKPHSMTM